MSFAFLMLVSLFLCVRMDFSIKMLCATSGQSWTYESSQRKLPSIAKAPGKFTANQKVSRIMLFWIFKIIVKSSMALNGNKGSEIEFTSFQFGTTSM